MVTKIFSKHPEHLGLCVTQPKKIDQILNLIKEHEILEAFRIYGLESLGEVDGPLTHADICRERLEYVKDRLRKADAIRNQLFIMYSDNNQNLESVFEFLQD